MVASKKKPTPAKQPAASNQAQETVDNSSDANKDGPVTDLSWVPPTKEEFQEFRKYRSFKLPGSDENYRVGDFVYICPDPTQGTQAQKQPKKKKIDTSAVDSEDEANDPGSDPWWIGEITEVRAKDEKCVFMNVKWMYTTITQLRDIGAKPILEGHEVIHSNYMDLLPVHAVEDRAYIFKFDEGDIFQEPISSDSVFYRSKVIQDSETEGKAKKRKRKLTAPKIEPLCDPSCFCKKPNKPLPLEIAPMVYCPSTTCMKWMHQECLESRSPPSVPTPEDLVAVTQSGADLQAKFVKVKEESEGKEESSDVPELIRTTATESIMRGTSKTGIVGNGPRVLLARCIVNRAEKKENIEELMNLWEEKMKNPIWAGEEKVSKKVQTGPKRKVWTCPDCQSVI